MNDWTRLADITPPIALGPLDGRYRGTVAGLVDHLSEPALNRMRLHVEVEWFIHLCAKDAVPGVRPLTDDEVALLRAIPAGFDAAGIAAHAAHERVTIHDVKAVEYLIKDSIRGTSLEPLQELVHFACTSEDINNLSYALMVKGAVEQEWLPAATALVADVAELARKAKAVPMLSRTHGQTATPTTLGKEFAVLAHRLGRQLERIGRQEYLGKINGATGTFGAHTAAVPTTDWIEISRTFVEHLGLTWNPLTTQIESHDWQAELYADVARFGRILHNLATDVWTYVSLGYFAQAAAKGSIGSSAMPHKINPIRFENAEANLEISAALLDTLAATLVTSRMQRDLTDSSSQRNIGLAFGHSLLAIDNVRRGLTTLSVNEAALAADLDSSWEVLAEPIQSAMRAASIAGVPGMENPYERLKDLTRGQQIDAQSIRTFVSGLELPAETAERLASLTPGGYVGLAETLVDRFLR
ncbi:adenylosuccinate lyase [Demequina capsici]|uniref:Adenylosuccinate lyase n=1 Tax=Demequina capsici TaxID=3075620 RepID=A0AA96J7U9_9MICO|nr:MULTISPECIES: adenylosuccinate lyase [unclassified Demequina]WNM24373.1 adenylosuccinate lyase [Demequina sp. OYTSA14]WNM27195.1 adenylosuccinate lyase [Demequina sp. PMTSA13]